MTADLQAEPGTIPRRPLRDPAYELWDGLAWAGRGIPATAVARAALSLSAERGRPRLGWVTPVPWPQVERRLAEAGVPVPGYRDGLLVAATGGWAFASRAAAECSATPQRLLVADTLDACQVTHLVTAAKRWAAVTTLTISASGQTFETRLLAEAIAIACAERGTGHALTEAGTPGGLSLRPGSGVNALYGAPLSVPFAMACAATGMARFRLAYEWFCQASGHGGAAAAGLAWEVPARRTPPLHVVLPRGSCEGTRLWALQVLRQSLGGRPAGRIWCDVSVEGSAQPGFQPDPAATTLRLAEALPSACTWQEDSAPVPAAGAAALAQSMITMYTVAVLAACLGVRCGVGFTSHPAVARYKAFLEQPPGSPAPGCPQVRADGESIVKAAARWLAGQPELSAAHLVRYDGEAPQISAAQLSEQTGRRWEVHAGSRWNHHSYQAVQGEPATGVVAVTGRPGSARPTGDVRLDRALAALTGHQAAIARATCASLAPRALLITR